MGWDDLFFIFDGDSGGEALYGASKRGDIYLLNHALSKFNQVNGYYRSMINGACKSGNMYIFDAGIDMMRKMFDDRKANNHNDLTHYFDNWCGGIPYAIKSGNLHMAKRMMKIISELDMTQEFLPFTSHDLNKFNVNDVEIMQFILQLIEIYKTAIIEDLIDMFITRVHFDEVDNLEKFVINCLTSGNLKSIEICGEILGMLWANDKMKQHTLSVRVPIKEKYIDIIANKLDKSIIAFK